MAKWTLTPTIPKWTLSDRLYSQVPWIHDSDLDEGRRCMWEVEYQRDTDVASCWLVNTYERGSSQSYLVLHASRGNGNDGGTITLAIANSPRFDVYAQECFALQSNPRRHPDEPAS